MVTAPLADIEVLLAERLGFDAKSVGSDMVASVVRRCAKDAGLTDLSTYAQRLVCDVAVWEHLMDSILVPETWFFRDGTPFDWLARVASTRAGRLLRVLSCPCSTGEEPFSIAMTLLDVGWFPGTFVIDAVDLRPTAVKTARKGLFGERTFRGDCRQRQERYFDREQRMWRVKPAVRATVRFAEGNLIAPDFFETEAPFDVVFCRNLLIYLHTDARRAVFANLFRVLNQTGTLVVGHAEASIARDNGFQPVGPSNAFAFTRATAKPTPRPATPRVTPVPRTSLPLKTVRSELSNTVRPGPAVVPEPAVALLAKANRLADAGHLKEAGGVCRELLRTAPASAEGHFLLGVLHDADNEADQAERCFRRALYLNPAHRDALLYLAFNRERRGDHTGAARLRDQARRIPPRASDS